MVQALVLISFRVPGRQVDWSRSSGGSTPIADHYAPSHTNPNDAFVRTRNSDVDLLPFTADSPMDFDSIANHRRSHAAEVGQIGPRLHNRASSSGDVPGALEPPYHDNPTITVSDPPSTPTRIPRRPFPGAVESDGIPLESYADSGPEYKNRQSAPLLNNSDFAQESEQMPYADMYPSSQNVTRRVNSGFEVLQPGTSDGAGAKRQTRKLQKKNLPPLPG